jgi:hypothetical protein
MIKELIALANTLDSKGHMKEADALDKVIRKMGGQEEYLGLPLGLIGQLASIFEALEQKRKRAKDDLLASIIDKDKATRDKLRIENILDMIEVYAPNVSLSYREGREFKRALISVSRYVGFPAFKAGLKDAGSDRGAADEYSEYKKEIKEFLVEDDFSEIKVDTRRLLEDKFEEGSQHYVKREKELEQEIYNEVDDIRPEALSDLIHTRILEEEEEAIAIMSSLLDIAEAYRDDVLDAIAEADSLVDLDPSGKSYQERFDDSLEPIGEGIEEIEEDLSSPYTPDKADRDSVFSQQEGPDKAIEEKYFPDSFFRR